MSTPTLVGTWLRPLGQAGLLVVGPSLGTSAAQLWQPTVDALDLDLGVLAWDLPGHAATPTGEPFLVSDLAAGVVALVDVHVGDGRGFSYAGDSVGGAVGLHLLLDAPDRVADAVLLSTGAQIGDPDAWLTRADTVRASGTEAVVEGSMERWFSPTTANAHPQLLTAFARTLRGVDDEGYAQVCDALATYDVRHRLHGVTGRVLAVAGADDVPTPPASLAVITDHVPHGRLVVLDDVAHLPPAEAPTLVAGLLTEHLTARTAQP